MKVGTDGTLIGAWTDLPASCQRILDIGTGSGLIAIMAAQRHPDALISAIDIDADCVAQTRENIDACPWSDRIEVHHTPLQDFNPEHKFDVIISNPPYFVDSQLPPDQQRSMARHTATLSFRELTDGVLRLLAPEGRFSLILPPAETERFLSAARGRLFITRRTEIHSTPTSGVKRVMTELQTEPPAEPAISEQIIIEDNGMLGYSEKYKALTKDFYLKF
ncbi:MAG: methyltransferase [Alistipes sp.]|nr:methyltransferase [Alistipes sp.]